MSDIVGPVFGAVAGAVAMYYFDIRKQRRQRRDDLAAVVRERDGRRSAIATALLIDLRGLEHRMRRLYANESAALWSGESPAQMFDVVRSDLVLLGPAAMTTVLEFFGFVRDLYLVLDRVHVTPGAAPNAQQHWTIRFKAACALDALNPAVDALLDQGGILPAQNVIRDFAPPDLPTIPSPRLLLRDPEANDA